MLRVLKLRDPTSAAEIFQMPPTKPWSKNLQTLPYIREQLASWASSDADSGDYLSFQKFPFAVVSLFIYILNLPNISAYNVPGIL